MLEKFCQLSTEENEELFETLRQIIDEKNYDKIKDVERIIGQHLHNFEDVDLISSFNEILLYYVYYFVFSEDDRLQCDVVRSFINICNMQLMNSFYLSDNFCHEMKIEKKDNIYEDNYEQLLFKISHNTIYKYYFNLDPYYDEVKKSDIISFLNDFVTSTSDRIFNSEIIGFFICWPQIMKDDFLSPYQKDKFLIIVSRLIHGIINKGYIANEKIQEEGRPFSENEGLDANDDTFNFVD